MYRGGSRTAATSKMEHFVIIVNDNRQYLLCDNSFQPLTIITKRSILDVAAVLDSPLMYNIIEYSSNYSKIPECLWFYSKNEATNFNADIPNDNFKSFKHQAILLENTKAQPAQSKSC